MPFLNNSGQLGESWISNLAWISRDLPMPTAQHKNLQIGVYKECYDVTSYTYNNI
jgi:hypothetical protein